MNKFSKTNTVKKISIILLFGFVLLSNAIFSQTIVNTFITNIEVMAAVVSKKMKKF
jgi:uncharacterized membrane protein